MRVNIREDEQNFSPKRAAEGSRSLIFSLRPRESEDEDELEYEYDWGPQND